MKKNIYLPILGIIEIITAMIVNSEQVVIEKRGVDTNTQLVE